MANKSTFKRDKQFRLVVDGEWWKKVEEAAAELEISTTAYVKMAIREKYAREHAGRELQQNT